MKIIKIILLKKPMVKVIYQDGTEEIKTARPILMKPWGIKATLEGRKMVTRRIVKDLNQLRQKKCPKGKPGDLLYIREPFRWPDMNNDESLLYKNDIYQDEVKYIPEWKPSIHMPREAARHWLQIENIEVGQVQDITEEECLKEGITKSEELDFLFCHRCYHNDSCDNCQINIKRFAEAWDGINANRKDKAGNILPYSWNHNPWVWAIGYKHVFTGRGE